MSKKGNDNQIDVEKEFTEFVKEFGGEALDETLPKERNYLNADYFFASENIVAELKRLSDDKSEDKKIQEKWQKKFETWMTEGVIGPIYGHVKVDSKTLPIQCQKELIELYKPPIQGHVKKANKQIKSTMAEMKIKSGKGLLILINDGNFALESDAVLYLLWRSLGNDFKTINSVIYLTVNMPAKSPISSKPSLVWVHVSRTTYGIESVNDDFAKNLYQGWCKYLEEKIGMPIEKILTTDQAILADTKYI